MPWRARMSILRTQNGRARQPAGLRGGQHTTKRALALRMARLAMASENGRAFGEGRHEDLDAPRAVLKDVVRRGEEDLGRGLAPVGQDPGCVQGVQLLLPPIDDVWVVTDCAQIDSKSNSEWKTDLQHLCGGGFECRCETRPA